MYGLGRILADFGVPIDPPCSHFLGKKRGVWRELEELRNDWYHGGGLAPPTMSLQDISLGLVWKCVALTRQRQALGLVRRIYPTALARKPATVPGS